MQQGQSMQFQSIPGGGMPGPHGQMAAPQYQSHPDVNRPQYQSNPDRAVGPAGMMQSNQQRAGGGGGQYTPPGAAGGGAPPAQQHGMMSLPPRAPGHMPPAAPPQYGVMALPPRADWTPPFSQQQGGMQSLPQAGPHTPRVPAPAADESDPSCAGVGLFFQQTVQNPEPQTPDANP